MPTVSDLYWDTCVSFTMLALFHADYLKLADHYIVMLVTKTLLQIEVVVVGCCYCFEVEVCYVKFLPPVGSHGSRVTFN